MEAVPTLETFLRRVEYKMANREPEETARMLGLMFCRPQLKLARKQLLPNLRYFDKRSGDHIDFFFVGFLPPRWAKRRRNSRFSYKVKGPRGKKWLFEEDNFNQWRQTIEERSNWRYSGGNDLLLVNVRPHPKGSGVQIDLKSAISISLEHLKDSEDISEVSVMFEKVFRYAERPDEDDPVSGFSNSMAKEIGASVLKNLFFAILPTPLQSDATAAFSYAVRDYSGEQESDIFSAP